MDDVTMAAKSNGSAIVEKNVEETTPLLKSDKSAISYSAAANGPRQVLSKQRHWKNLLGLSVAFMLTFTAYGSLQNLQSTLNYKGGLGMASLGVIYGCLIVSCLFAPVLIKTLGPKWTVAISLFCYSFYTAANFYPEFYTLIPTAAILGFSAGPLWAAQGTYLNTLAMNLADVSNQAQETVINQFNGVFFFFVNSSQIWGNMLSSVIFSANVTTEQLNETDLWKCGRNGTGNEDANLDDPGKTKTNLLLSLYLGFGILGAMMAAIFLDRIGGMMASAPNNSKTGIGHLLEVFQVMGTSSVALLIPLMTFCGLQQAYIFGDFTKVINIRRECLIFEDYLHVFPLFLLTYMISRVSFSIVKSVIFVTIKNSVTLNRRHFCVVSFSRFYILSFNLIDRVQKHKLHNECIACKIIKCFGGFIWGIGE